VARQDGLSVVVVLACAELTKRLCINRVITSREERMTRLANQSCHSTRYARRLIGHRENGIDKPAFELRVVAELFKQLSVIFHQANKYAAERLIVLDPRILLVRVFRRVLKSGISGNARRYLFRDQLMDAVFIRPRNIAELIIEGFRMWESRSSSGSGLCPLPLVGTGSISASVSGSWILTAACFSRR